MDRISGLRAELAIRLCFSVSCVSNRELRMLMFHCSIESQAVYFFVFLTFFFDQFYSLTPIMETLSEWVIPRESDKVKTSRGCS